MTDCDVNTRLLFCCQARRPYRTQLAAHPLEFFRGSETGRFTPRDSAIFARGTDVELGIPDKYEHVFPDPEPSSTFRGPELARHSAIQKSPIEGVQGQAHAETRKREEYCQCGDVKVESGLNSSLSTCKCLCYHKRLS